jgi:hypothetical protein
VTRALIVFTLLLAACRPDPGASQYQNQETFDGSSCGLPGPDPFQPGSARLTFGAFYECASSDSIPVDDVTSHIYLYGTPVTVTMQSDTDHIEGLKSDDILLTGQTWWGMGINWDVAHDLSAWKTMHVSFKSSDPAFATFTIGVNNGEMSAQKTITVNATDYGWASDGAWHSLAIPLAAFAGFDPSMTTAPLVLGGGAGPGGARLQIDDLYFAP